MTTAVVFSSWSGVATGSCARIQSGGSAAAAAVASSSRKATWPRRGEAATSVRAGGRADGEHELLFVAGADLLVEVVQLVVVLDGQVQEAYGDVAREEQLAAGVLRLAAVRERRAVDVIGLRQDRHLQARRQCYLDLVVLLVEPVHVDRVHARRVLERVPLGRAEQRRRHQPAAASRARPARDAHVELRDQRRRGALPVGMVRELDVDAGRNRLLDLVLEELLAAGFVGFALPQAARQGLLA